MCQMKASLINIRLTSRYSAGSYAFAVKGLCALFSAFKIRSGTQFDGCTDLSTLCRDKSHTYLPLPQIVCLNSPRFWETHDQRFPGSLSLSLRRAGRREPWEWGWEKSGRQSGDSTRIFNYQGENVSHIGARISRNLKPWTKYHKDEII